MLREPRSGMTKIAISTFAVPLESFILVTYFYTTSPSNIGFRLQKSSWFPLDSETKSLPLMSSTRKASDQNDMSGVQSIEWQIA